MAEESFIQNPPPLVPPRRGIGRAVAGTALAAFMLGAVAVGYAAWDGLLPIHRPGPTSVASPAPAPIAAPAAGPGAAGLAAQQDQLEGRMAALEQRLDGLSSRADAASGNAARAEALLVAFAARRALDRGAPLGHLEDQLRLRFGDAQPHAVTTVIDAARTPVTLYELLAGLDSLAPSLTQAPASVGAWAKLKRELSSLFVIRRDSAPSPMPQVTLGRAKVLLEAGRTEDAIAEVQRLPGASEAGEWFAAARRFDAARRALDVLETAALLETNALKDGSGKAVDDAVPMPAAN